jgi:hypothetical protein
MLDKKQTRYGSIIELYLRLAKTNAVKSRLIKPDYWFDMGKFAEFHTIENYFKQIETI